VESSIQGIVDRGTLFDRRFSRPCNTEPLAVVFNSVFNRACLTGTVFNRDRHFIQKDEVLLWQRLFLLDNRSEHPLTFQTSERVERCPDLVVQNMV
jgi:hypothetical protein